MAFRLRTHESAAKGLKRIIKKELRSAIERLQAKHVSDEAIHDARKRIKKVRAALRLVAKDIDIGPALDHMRDAAHALSPIRDTASLIGSAQSLCSHHADELPANTCQSLIARLDRNKADARRSASRENTVPKAIHLLRRVDGACKSWAWNRTGRSRVVSQIRRTYKKARRAMRHLSLRSRSENVHECRKRTKDLWYALRLFEKRGAPRRDLSNLEHLETWLGDDHNLAALHAAMSPREGGGASPPGPALEAVVQHEQRALRQKALSLGRRTLLHPPKRFEKRLRVVLR